MIAPKKKIVGTARPWTANQRTVKIGYVKEDLLVVILYNLVGEKIILKILNYYLSCSNALKRSVTNGAC